MRKSIIREAIALILLTWPAAVTAQPGELVQQMVSSTNQLEEPDFEESDIDIDAAGAARAAEADANFEAVMSRQNAAPSNRRRVRSFEDLSRQVTTSAGIGPAGATVEVPLVEFSRVRNRLKTLREMQARAEGPAVVLGAADYIGEARTGALALKLRLRVTLGRPNTWKTVPLVGDDVVLVRATDGGRSLSVSRRNGYHVWVTQRTGEMSLELDILVPARGPRGSIEFDFLVARTPVTTFQCRFPVPNLEPKLSAAVHSQVRTRGTVTVLEATLRPTTRIHLVGFRDFGQAEGRPAKIYAESLNLVSVAEGAIDVFSVVRYTILYAGTREFQILVPPGLTVVSADGEGAFRFELVKRADGTLLNGETAFPIRKNYEISLRLHRETPKEEKVLDVPIPRALGVEREHGWLAVEVPSKLRLEEAERRDILVVDERQLPAEMVRNADS
ncbi:MAG: hypothetical protein V3T05_10125, partial [Myxococcota bacterium]